MSIHRDLEGRRFGRLVALEFAFRKDGQSHWKCRCDCGTELIVTRSNLISGNTKSCGCSRKRQRVDYLSWADVKEIVGVADELMDKAAQVELSQEGYFQAVLDEYLRRRVTR